MQGELHDESLHLVDPAGPALRVVIEGVDFPVEFIYIFRIIKLVIALFDFSRLVVQAPRIVQVEIQ